MKIGSFDPSGVAPTPSDRRPAAASRDSARAEPSATVDLSQAATQLQAAPAAVDGPFDAAKVERISQAIRDGQFEVNAEAIADKLISNAREMLGPVGSS